MTRDEIDVMWQRALHESVKDGEQFTRYHFAALVLEAAAVEFNQPHMELFMDQIQDAIRAMKPEVKP
jgi:hypothetical protein